MRKYLPYILILIILVGLFSPLMKVTATDPMGTCTFPLAAGGTSTRQNISQAECNNLILQGGGGFGGSTENPEGWRESVPTGYTLLAPLPCDANANPPIPGCVNGKLRTFNPGQDNNLGAYLNLMIKIIIGLAAVLSVIMIVFGGMEYMTSELAHSKEAGKEKITQAILGLLIALSAWVLLNTINPDLLKSDINPPPTSVSTPTSP